MESATTIKKGVCIFISKQRTMYYLNNTVTVLKIIIVGALIIIAALLVKYKPVYKVNIAGTEIGYVRSKNNIENAIKNYINTDDENIAFIDIENMPEYEFNLVPWDKETDEDKILQEIKKSSKITYKLYSVTVGSKNKAFVSTLKEAEDVVASLKEEFNGMVDLEIGVEEIYTDNLEKINSISVQVAKTNLDKQIISGSNSSVKGIILSKPVQGVVSSRFGSRSLGNHKGLDIAAHTGTIIKAASKGTVTFTGWYGGYGNLIIISHGNGVETYYGHCSKIYANVGDEVTKDTTIGEVGSTGRSTGPHLHLEVRINGVPQNPQKYLYK